MRLLCAAADAKSSRSQCLGYAGLWAIECDSDGVRLTPSFPCRTETQRRRIQTPWQQGKLFYIYIYILGLVSVSFALFQSLVDWSERLFSCNECDRTVLSQARSGENWEGGRHDKNDLQAGTEGARGRFSPWRVLFGATLPARAAVTRVKGRGRSLLALIDEPARSVGFC